MQKKRTLALSAALALTLVAGACSSSSDTPAETTVAVAETEAPAETTPAETTPAETTPAETTPAETTPAATETTAAAAAAGGEDVIAEIGDQYKGKKVTVFSSIRDIEADRLEQAWKPFEDATGIDIEHEPSAEFEQQIRVRVEGGNAPDIAVIPQPGLLADLARQGKVVEQPALADYVKNSHISGWAELGTVDGKFYGPPFGANVKSMVWYSPAKFEEKGYAVPTTWDEMIALSDKIVADGGTPWCIGAESGGATGWVLTDWMEDVMLREVGPETYDKWVSHEIPFNDPAVASAIARVGTIAKNDKYVKGGAKSIATTSFQESGLGIQDGSCYMHRQASFYANQFPEGTTKGPDGDVNIFYFPTIDPAKGKPVLGGGELLAAFSDKPEVAATLKYLTSAQYANSRAAIGSWLSPNKGLDLSVIPDQIDRQFGELLQGATVFRFDASDLMPGSVGAGTFWTGMVDWVTGGKDDKAALDAIEASWPAA
jgi:alpha-glucoside transport system substrate-binding protein